MNKPLLLPPSKAMTVEALKTISKKEFLDMVNAGNDSITSGVMAHEGSVYDYFANHEDGEYSYTQCLRYGLVLPLVVGRNILACEGTHTITAEEVAKVSICGNALLTIIADKVGDAWASDCATLIITAGSVDDACAYASAVLMISADKVGKARAYCSSAIIISAEDAGLEFQSSLACYIRL